jgi:hypothetical protein
VDDAAPAQTQALMTPADLEALLVTSNDHPVMVFKHSTT